MGLTIHFKMWAPRGSDASRAEEIMTKLRKRAGCEWIEGRVDSVLPLATDYQALRLGSTWIFAPVPDRPTSRYEAEVVPIEGFILRVRPGKDCETLALGLCRYPTQQYVGDQYRRTGFSGWRWQSFCKTQFASLHGWEHFRRCHLAVLGLLDSARELGCRVKVSDEGEYWPRRNEAALRRNVGMMNCAIAGAAGAMKDFDGEKGAAGVQSPIFAHPQFEHLEAQGAAQGHVAALRKALPSR
jgi:hypothetical protein